MGSSKHPGGADYEGVHDPTSAHAEDCGNGTDVLGTLGRLRMTAMR